MALASKPHSLITRTLSRICEGNIGRTSSLNNESMRGGTKSLRAQIPGLCNSPDLAAIDRRHWRYGDTFAAVVLNTCKRPEFTA
jgi:hypothetical protein